MAIRNRTIRVTPADVKYLRHKLVNLGDLKETVPDWYNRLLTHDEVQTLYCVLSTVQHLIEHGEPLKNPNNSDLPSGKSINPGKPEERPEENPGENPEENTDEKPDGNGKDGKKSRRRRPKKPFGGQKNHKGANHKREIPDEVVELRDQDKEDDPDWIEVGFKWGQTLDIVYRKNVIEHHSIVYENKNTGETYFVPLPEGNCGTIRVGNGLKTHIVLLRDGGHLSYEKIA